MVILQWRLPDIGQSRACPMSDHHHLRRCLPSAREWTLGSTDDSLPKRPFAWALPGGVACNEPRVPSPTCRRWRFHSLVQDRNRSGRVVPGAADTAAAGDAPAASRCFLNGCPAFPEESGINRASSAHWVSGMPLILRNRPERDWEKRTGFCSSHTRPTRKGAWAWIIWNIRPRTQVHILLLHPSKGAEALP